MNAYWTGFSKEAEAYGIDPLSLIKAAGPRPEELKALQRVLTSPETFCALISDGKAPPRANDPHFEYGLLGFLDNGLAKLTRKMHRMLPKSKSTCNTWLDTAENNQRMSDRQRMMDAWAFNNKVPFSSKAIWDDNTTTATTADIVKHP